MIGQTQLCFLPVAANCFVVRAGSSFALPHKNNKSNNNPPPAWLRLIIIMVATTARTCFLLSATIVGLVLLLHGTKDGKKKTYAVC